ncbi:hypothetical protein AKJ16_DCAP24803 [Drosera capensis]
MALLSVYLEATASPFAHLELASGNSAVNRIRVFDAVLSLSLSPISIDQNRLTKSDPVILSTTSNSVHFILFSGCIIVRKAVMLHHDLWTSVRVVKSLRGALEV